MSLLVKLKNLFRKQKLQTELDEEFQSHLDEAVSQGRDATEARRSFGNFTLTREESQDLKLTLWLDNLKNDFTFALRQLSKNRVATVAATLSLALAIGACTASFRLIDALLFRPLPVSNAERLYYITHAFKRDDGKVDYSASFNYPLYREIKAGAGSRAQVLAISYSSRTDLTFGSDAEMEKAYRQYFSGNVFSAFGLQPALGRLLSPQEEVTPGGHPVAVISYDYWQRRFGGDRGVLGKTFRMDKYLYQIIGVGPKGFSGTETGSPADVFTPTLMNAEAIPEKGWQWFRAWVSLGSDLSPEAMQAKVKAIVLAHRQENVKTFPPHATKERINEYLDVRIALESASAGVSGAQKQYRESLGILAVLVALVLLIACANVANLMTAQAASRAREMALRVSIGAGRFRLIQLVMVESAIVALASSALGFGFALWAAPEVMSRINPPDNPMRLELSHDYRVFAFLVLLALGVTILFGLVPALRASSVRPVAALKGGEDPHSKRRLMHALVAAQIAFCFLVHFAAGLFFATFDRITNQSLGLDPNRVLTLQTTSRSDQAIEQWDQLAAHLRSLPGIESVGFSNWALLSGAGWNSSIWLKGNIPETITPNFLAVSPQFLATMKIAMAQGRDFRNEDLHPRVAIVNRKFANQFFPNENVVGKYFEVNGPKQRPRIEIVGIVENARYSNMREDIPPTVYVPFNSLDPKTDLVRKKDNGTYVVRSKSDNPLALATFLRQEVTRFNPNFRVSNLRTQQELVEQHTVRERLLAILGAFFAIVALVLAAVGLYGVLDYSVLQRRRELGIRRALGAPAGNLAWRVSAEIFGMLILGSGAGLLLGFASESYFESLLFGVKTREWQLFAAPLLTIGLASILASLPPILRALRIDPASMLRAE